MNAKMNVCLSGGGEECALFVHCIGWKISLVIDYFPKVVVPEFVLVHSTPHKARPDTHQPYVHIIRGCTLFCYTVTIVVLLLCYFCPWSSFLVSSNLLTWKFNLILCHRIFPIPVTSSCSEDVLSGVFQTEQNHWQWIWFHQLHFSMYLLISENNFPRTWIFIGCYANNDQGPGKGPLIPKTVKDEMGYLTSLKLHKQNGSALCHARSGPPRSIQVWNFIYSASSWYPWSLGSRNNITKHHWVLKRRYEYMHSHHLISNPYNLALLINGLRYNSKDLFTGSWFKGLFMASSKILS